MVKIHLNPGITQTLADPMTYGVSLEPIHDDATSSSIVEHIHLIVLFKRKEAD